MATIIDALLVTLSLDPSGYKRGAQAASDSQKKLKDDISSLEEQIAAVRLKSTKATADQDKLQIKSLSEVLRQKRKALTETKGAEQDQLKRQKEQTQGLDKTKQALFGVLAVLTAGAGIKAFVTDIVAGDAAMGRLSANLGESVQTATAFGAVIASLGGKAEEGAAALQNLAAIRFAEQAKGDYSKAPVLSRLGVSPSDLNDLDGALSKIAATAKTLPKQLFFQYATEAGFSSGAINALELGNVELAKQIELAKAREHINDELIAQEQKLIATLNNLLDGAKGFARDGLGAINAILKDIAQNLPVVIGMAAGLAIALVALNGAAILASIGMAAMWIAAAAPAVLLIAAFVAVGAAIGGFIEWLTKAKSGIDFAKQAAAAFSALLRGDWGGAWKAAGAAAKDVLDGILGGIHAVIEGAKDMAYALTHHGEARPKQQTGATGSWDAPSASPTASAQSQRAAFAINYLKSQGISDQVARGIVAGSIAESQLDPGAVNPKSGAFGIGQWLGPRLKALRAQFGPNATFDQQLQFLVQELKGGDRGGAAVLRSQNSQDAAAAYINKFMRPAAGAETTGDLSRASGALAMLGPSIDPGLTGGAGAAVAGQSTDNSRSSNIHSDVQINRIEVTAPAGADPKQFGAKIAAAVRTQPFVAMANAGLA